MAIETPPEKLVLRLLLVGSVALTACSGAFAAGKSTRVDLPSVSAPAVAATEPAVPPNAMPTGNPANGRKAYEVCAVCHLENGAGRPDGVFPQLAGQHASVTYGQIIDIRDGHRENPIMYPFAKTLTKPQTLADLAVYIESLPLPPDNGKGPGSDYALGAKLYTRDCAVCHGESGRGNGDRLVPVVASQHYAYLARQIDDFADQYRCNVDPEMVAVVTHYSPKERAAVADYISRLEETPQLVPAPDAAGE